MDLVCCICAFADRGEPHGAEVIIRGYSVCVPHAPLVVNGDPVLSAARAFLHGHLSQHPAKTG